MKVGTDGCLLGAWADASGARRIADVGTGSGLVALMLAQRNTGDRIVSNPPYFDESLKCPDAGRRMARHSDTLPMGELLSVAAALLTDDGRVALVLPYAQREGVLRLAEARALHLVRETHVVPVEGASPKRWLAELARRPSPCVPDVLTLETPDHRRTAAYAELMGAFYL